MRSSARGRTTLRAGSVAAVFTWLVGSPRGPPPTSPGRSTGCPRHLQFRYFHVLSLLALGDKAGLRRACSELLDRFDSSTDFRTANDVAWYCVLAPDALADREAPVRLAELAVNGAPEARKAHVLEHPGRRTLPRRAVPGSH